MKVRKLAPLPERTALERCAIAACRAHSANHDCPCERSPSVCDHMKLVAFETLWAYDGTIAMAVSQEDRKSRK